MNQRRLHILGGLAIVLAGIRFGLVPWIDTQSNTRDELSVLTKRLDRASGVIESRETIEKSLIEIEAQVAQGSARFPVVQSSESFRLQTQQSMRELATASELSQDLFGWVLEGEVANAGLRYVRARAQYSGDMERVARFHGKLESDFPNMLIREVTVTSPSPIGKGDESFVSMVIVADFHFRALAGSS